MSCQDINIIINSEPTMEVVVNNGEDINVTLQGANEYVNAVVFNGAAYTVVSETQLEYPTFGNAVIKPNSQIVALNGLFLTKDVDYNLNTSETGIVFLIDLNIGDQVVLYYAEL